MNDPTPQHDAEGNSLQQQLLELHYGLLEADEAEALQQRIQTEPDVAQQWAAALRIAGKLADAAQLNQPVSAAQAELRAASRTSELDRLVAQAKRLDADAPASPTAPDVRPSPPTGPATSSVVQRRPLFGLRVFLAIAAMLMIVVGWRGWNALPQRPATALLLEARPLTDTRDLADNQFRVSTARATEASSLVSGGPLPLTPASLTFSVFARDTLVYRGEATTAEGEATIEVPPTVLIPPGSTLQVDAVSEQGDAASVQLPLRTTRCLTYLSTDRPVYRPGETLYFRSLTLERQTLRGEFELPIRFQLLDPAGAAVPGMTIDGVTDRGVGNGAFTLPSGLAGGSYTLIAESLDEFFPKEKRTVEVREYRVPRFTKTLQLDQRSYGPADEVRATATIRRAEGEPLAETPVLAMAVVDGKVVATDRLTTDLQGECTFEFTLPELIRIGDGLISLVIDDGGTRETLSETLPIQTDRVELAFYPEGGYLVEGVRNRVYFVARNPRGEPVHVEGEVMTRGGRRVASLATLRDGMGRFELTPETSQRYVIKLTNPLDVSTTASLPVVVADQPVLDTGEGVFAADAPLECVVRTTQTSEVRLQAVCRGMIVGEVAAELKPGSNVVTIPVAEKTAGVIRLTLLTDDTRRPLAERLVFRRGTERLQVELVETNEPHFPGQPLRMTLQVRDEQQQPVAAVLGISVVDQAALSLQSQETPELRTHFLLTSEVENPADLEHANFYLEDSPAAEQSLDLLLGTQGWRRFLERETPVDQVAFEEQLQRLLKLDGTPRRVAAVTNGSQLHQQWSAYRNALDRVWSRVLRELRWLLLPLFLVWSLLAWLRSKWNAPAAICLLFAVSGASWMVGCGAQSAQTSALSDAGREASIDAEPGNVLPSPDSKTPAAEMPVAEMLDVPGSTDGEIPIPTAPKARSAAIATTERPAGDAAAIEEPQRPILTDADIERLLAARGIDSDELTRRLLDELRFPVREYAHRHTPSTSRQDFAETLLWQPLVITDSQGRATIRFDLSDSVTAFRVHADAHATTGRIGSGDGLVVSRLPFQLEPKLPLAVTVGDTIRLPVAVINATDDSLSTRLEVSAEAGLEVTAAETSTMELAARQRQRIEVPITVGPAAAGQRRAIEVTGTADDSPLTDRVRRELFVAAAGYPQRRSSALTIDGSATVPLDLPDEFVPGSLQITVRAYPSPLADLLTGVESILREPHGCFEQASAMNYPNALALNYMRDNNVTNPQVTQRAETYLQSGYQKLTRYECERRGYEWFGEDPGHEALSAFGLMQFNDMRAVMAVDPEMISRTRKWLMGRRDGQGGWERNPRHLHQWAVQQDVVNAYVLWALTESDAAVGNAQASAVELRDELDRLQTVANRSNDAYLLALSAATLANAGRTDNAVKLLDQLRSLQANDGSLTGQTTVTQSGGKSLKVETTALAVIAWSKLAGFEQPLEQAAKWLISSRGGNGGFGSTQATVLALKALLAHGRTSAVGGGRLTVSVGDQTIGQAVIAEAANRQTTIEIAGLAAALQAADIDPRGATLQLNVDGELRLNCTVEVAFHQSEPVSDEQAAVRIETELSKSAAVAGETLEIEGLIENVTAEGLPMTVAIIGLPGGLEPRPEQLDELRRAGAFDYYELRPREVILYWRTLAPKAPQRLRLQVTAEIPGQYTGPASRAYLYYTAEQKHWTPPLVVEIASENE